MKYTYHISLQGGPAGPNYIEFQLDRQISGKYCSFGSDIIGPDSPKLREMLEAISNTPNVVKPVPGDYRSGSGLIVADGTRLLVQIVGCQTRRVPEIANQLIKKVQRRMAKGERRQRIQYKALQTYIKQLNAKTYGQ